MAENEIRLKVGELTAREEAGRGIVRLDSTAMKTLGIKEGDVVEIEGGRKTAAIAVRAYPADVGLNIIRMDGITRRNANSGVGEFVKIRKADVKEARKVTISPAEKGMSIFMSPELFKQNIHMRPVVKGDIIVPSPVVKRRTKGSDFFGSFFGVDFEEFFPEVFTPFPSETRFVVIDTEPKGIVRIGDMTELEILPELPETVKLEERAIPTVTYEDVGGIREIIHKVREMIELPLRHPELFERLGIDPPKGVLLYGPPGTGKTLLAKAVANESGANFYSISGPEIYSMWYGKSLPYDEEIFILENGIPKRIPIGKIVENGNKRGLKVLSFNKRGKIEFAEVTDLIKHKNDSKILEIRTRSGRKIRVTDYHSLFTLKNNRIVPIKTSELVPGESYIAIPNFIPLPEKIIEEIDLLEALKIKDFGLVVKNIQVYLKEAKKRLGHDKVAEILGCKKKYLYDIINKNVGIKVAKFLRLMKEAKINLDISKIRIYSKRTSSLPAKVKLTEDLSTFLGLWVAEGSYTKNLEVRLTVSERELEEVQKLCEKLFGKVSVYRDKRSRAFDVIVCSKVLGIFLKEILGLEDGADRKRIPEIILSSKKDNIAAFLRGYFSGDGSAYPNQRGVITVESNTKSKNLANDLLYALLHFGIVAKMYEGGHQNYRVCFSGIKNLRRFQRIGFLDKLKNLRVANYINSIKWERSEQIPLIPEIKDFLSYTGMRIPFNAMTIGKERLEKLMEKCSLDYSDKEEIEEITTNDIYWDRIEEIREVPYEGEYVYDISVCPNENFVAGFGGVFAHNTEENLRNIFAEAEKNAPSIIFIDEIDAIAPKREEVHGEVEKRTVSQLLTLMDGLKKRGKVIVIAATNIPNAVDPALRRAGRFDREIEFPVPDRNGRLEILKIHTRNMPLDKDVDLNWLADITYGYVGADIWALCKEAAMSALRRVLPEIKWKEEKELPKEIIEKLVVKKSDFEAALRMVEPSAMREVLVEIPKVKWEDIGGLEDVKQSLKEMVEWPLKHPESFERLGIQPPKGILLYGPPGCGKTLLAKAVANESGANFISIKGPEVYSKWVGESERAIRELFRRAKQVSPAIILFDEIDALAPRRGIYTGTHITETVVSQLLTEMSGIEEVKNVVIIAASNRPDLIDPALLRPGRIDRFVLVPAPDEKARLEIFKVHTRKMPLKDVDIKELAKRTEGFSGADIEALCREAAMNALRENIKAKEVKKKHFEEALKKIVPSLTKDVQEYYEKFIERQKKIRKAEEEKVEPGYIG